MKSIKKIYEIFKNILPNTVNFKLIYTMAVIYSIFETASIFIFSYVGIDRAFQEKNIAIFIITVLTVFVIQVASNITFAIAFSQGNKMTREINISTREKLFKKAMDLDKEYHNTHATGATINTLVGDVEIISEGFFWPSLYMIIHSIEIISSLILCLVINVKLSLIILILGPVIFILSKLVFKGLTKIDDQRREARKKRLSHINDSVMGIKTIKVLNLEEKNNKEYKRLVKNFNRLQIKKFNHLQLLWRVVDVLNFVASGILFYLSYNEFIALSLSYGELYLFFSLFERCIYSITGISDNFEAFSDVLVCAEKINNMLNRKPLIEDKEGIDMNPEKLKGQIEFKNVTFKYPKGEQVLTDFSLKIEPKQKVALVGRTGSGKSTIASLIYRFYEPSEGQILLDGKDYLDLPQQFIRGNIGFILQDALLFDDTIINNIRYGKKEATLEEIQEICKKVGLDEVIEKSKDKYDTRVGEGGLLLSNGQKQLVAFARVLLRNPDIIILDEATSSIDSKTEQLIQKCINEQFKDKTCIFIAHRLSTIKDVDNIVYLDKGRIIEQGSHDELIKLKQRYYKLYTNQFYTKLLNEELNIKEVLE